MPIRTIAGCRRLAALPAVAAVCLLAGCQIDRRPLRIAYNDFAPYTTIAQDGRPAGLAVEAVNEAARRAGVRVEWIATPEGTSRALDSGRVDAVALATITAKRQRTWTFTLPWWSNEMVLISRLEHPIGPENVAGARVTLRDSQFALDLAQRLLPGANFELVELIGPQFRSLCSSQVDAMFVEARRINRELMERPGVCSVPLAMRPVPGAVLMMGTASRGPDSRITAIARELEPMALDGTLFRIASRWSLPSQGVEYARRAFLGRKQKFVWQLLAAAGTLVLLLGGWQLRRLRRSEVRAREALAEAQRDRLRAAESEGRFESFMQHLPAMAIVKDEGGRIVYINRMYERVFGTTAAGILGRKPDELYPPELAEEAAASDARVWREGTPVQVTERIPGVGGLHEWMLFKFPMRGFTERPLLGALGVDVTRERQAERALRQARERFQALFEHAPMGYHELDADGIIRRVNDAECQLLGYARSELIGRHASELVEPSEREQSRVAVARKLSGQQALQPYRRTYSRGDGGIVRCEVHETLVREGERIAGIHSALIDVTQREQAERLERDWKQVLETITADEPVVAVLEAIARLVRNHDGTACSITLEPLAGLASAADTPGKPEPPAGLASAPGTPGELGLLAGRMLAADTPGKPEPPAGLASALDVQPGVYVRRVVGRRDGSAAAIRVAHYDEKEMAAVLAIAEGLVRLALDHEFLLDQLRFRAEHDALTGLPNRYVVEQTLDRFLREPAHPLTAVLFIDLDGFKWVNDTHGHDAGDRLLAGVAERLTGVVRHSDLVARMGGDEFVILLHALLREDEAVLVAQKVLTVLDAPFHIGGSEIFVSPSIGIASFPRHATDRAGLLIKADRAMYQAKQAGKNRYASATVA